VEVHIPTDLLGMTLGFYEDARSDGNDEAAVATFCSKVKKQVQNESFYKGGSGEELRELVVRFDCCQSWIAEESKRVATKKEISSKIEDFCRNHPLNKHRLLLQKRTGYYLALLAAIRSHPEDRDWELILRIDPKQFPPGFAYFKLVEAIEALKTSGKVTADQLKQLHDWVNGLPNARKHIADRLDALLK
jgi:hypothetical protein